MKLRIIKHIIPILALLAVSLTACDSSPLLRDNFMGKRLVEPDRLPQRVPRDARGNPRLDQQSKDLNEFWNRLKIW
ncbi:MAG: hypothetical protein HOK21_20815 [Rhodospirillaceae bacterium]|jgi:hypothetical protein|nr:hypothetical protein [Rhodospirillaceae bacterium]MBT4042377.1 hypothetical protein [Rhodospirillaceae bacterium]MBT4691327.1 hypothetical protein [Rhodospirillaceae bacterium]MBT5083734.1 hypothetical protein [Rhodospirillaceae bacterium]MBT5526534.1 hypothetical protein [Rhodospirillaceae bacterium]